MDLEPRCIGTNAELRHEAATIMLKAVCDGLPEPAQYFAYKAFELNDFGAAGQLIAKTPRGTRGALVFLAYVAGVKNPVFREMFKRVWQGDHTLLLAQAQGGWPQIRRMFLAAEFPNPFPAGPLTIYRAAHGMELPDDLLGAVSWTTSLDVACWYAEKFTTPPVIMLTATVDGSEIIYWSNDADDCEVVTREPPAAKQLPWSPEWQERSARMDDLRMARLLGHFEKV